MGPSSAQRQPWWQRVSSAAADSSFAGCSFRTVVSTQCSVEPDEKGVPQRRCERIVRRLRECPGRPVEVIERVEESSTEANYTDGAKDLHKLPPRHYPHSEEHPRDPILQSDVGQLFEDFFKVAAEVEQNYFTEVPSAGVLQPEPPENSWDGSKQQRPTQPNGEDSLLGRLFRRRPQDCPTEPPLPKDKGTTTAPQYKDYSQDFQEV